MIGLALLIPPASAEAVIWLQGATSEIYVSAVGPSPDDVVTVSGEGEGPAAVYVFSDTAGVIATSPCVLRSPTEGHCPATGRTKMTVELGNGKNRFTPSLSEAGEDFTLRYVSVNGGRERDVIDLRGLPAGVFFAQALGGNGPDVIFAGPAKIDRVNGAFGDDRLIGSAGRDVQVGGPDDDVLIGRGGRDRQTGGRGRDRISGGGGRDILDGGSGADLLDGGGAFDLLLGGTGFDRAKGSVSRAEQRRAKSVERFP